MTLEIDQAFDENFLKALSAARHVAVMTGAGVSAESGVPTFRDAQTGLWAQYNPEELATPEAFRANPKLVWDWYEWRRSLIAKAEPNPGHYALAEMASLFPRFSLITQNVDGFHQKAGSRNVTCLHGDIWETRCFSCGLVHESWDESQDPPRCKNCDGNLRPGVVWFGESLPAKATQEAAAVVHDCDVFFSVGTSARVYPAAGYVLQAKRQGALTVEVNPRATEHSTQIDHALKGPSGVILPALVEAIKRARS